MRRFFARFANLFRRRHAEGELAREIESHLALLRDDFERRGFSPEEAVLAARRSYGGVEQAKELHREARSFVWIEQLFKDVRYGCRILRRNPGFGTVSVLTLALGIGANTAVFSVVDAAMLRSLPFRDPDRLVYFWAGDTRRGTIMSDGISVPEYLSWKNQSHAFEQMAAFRGDGAWFALSGGDDPRRIHGDLISADWLPTLGVAPAMGRNFRRQEELPGGDESVILADRAWRQYFDADPDIIGRKLILNNRAYTVVGVLPASFTFYDREIFAPLVLANSLTAWERFDTQAVARLKTGVTLTHAQDEMIAIAGRLAAQYPATNKYRGVRLISPANEIDECCPTQRNMHRGLWIMLGAVSMVMLIACANVANLLLARAAARHREIAIRRALGCTQHRVIRQLVTENLLIFIAGGTLGLLFADWSRTLLVKIAADYIGNSKITLDSRVLLFSITVSLATGILFGLAPALQASKASPNDALKQAGASTTGGLRAGRTRGLLVVCELALAMILLVGFGLLIRSFLRVQSIPLGFDGDRLLATSASLPEAKYRTAPQRATFARKVLERVRELPGVVSVGMTDSLPLSGAGSERFIVESRPEQPSGAEAGARTLTADPTYFRTLGVPLLAGRAFTDRDSENGLPVAMINQTMARRYFLDENPLGLRIRLLDEPLVWREIVGIIADIRQRNLEEDSEPIVYRPWFQLMQSDLSIAVRVRSASELSTLPKALRAKLRSVDREQIWDSVQTMQDIIYNSESLSLRRPIVMLLAAFGSIALVLAIVGVYGVMSYFVTARTKEIGIRMALGAEHRVVVGLVLREVSQLVLAGLMVGLVGALALTQLLPTGHIGWSGSGIFLYGVTRTDAVTYGGILLLLSSVAFVAGYVPARRATKVDPMVALRYA